MTRTNQTSCTVWAALGVFDGVHLGHRSMLRLARDNARLRSDGDDEGMVIAISFHPHPRAVLAGDAPPMLCTLEDRIELLTHTGADLVEVLPFTHALSQLSPADFVDNWLAAPLRLGGVVVGDNFRFGKGASGDPGTLQGLCHHHGIEVVVAPLALDDGAPVSSSRIRQHLLAGRVDAAAHLFGRPFSLSGTVVTGARRGRELGFPTANLGWPRELCIPADGVYAGTATSGDTTWVAAISVGTNPQFQDPDAPEARTVEAHLLDYDRGDWLYGQRLQVAFHERLRDQAVFESVDALVEQIRADVERTRQLASAREKLAPAAH